MSVLQSGQRVSSLSKLMVVFGLGIAFARSTGYAQTPDYAKQLVEHHLRPSHPTIADLQCEATVIIRAAAQPHPPIVLHLLYAFKAPDKFKMVVSSRLAGEKSLDFFADKVGMVYGVSGDRAWAYEPFSERILSYDLNTVSPICEPITRLYGSGDLAEIQSYVRGFQLAMPTLENIADVTLVGEEQQQGKRVAKIKLAFKKHFRFYHHTVTYLILSVEPERRFILQAVGYNEGGNPVIETTFSEPVQLNGKWVPLRSVTKIAKGQILLRLAATRKRPDGGEEPTTVEANYPLSERTIERSFFLYQGKFVLLKESVLKDNEGKPLIQITFRNYLLNRGLPDDMFNPPSPP